MKNEGQKMATEEMEQIRQSLEVTPEIEEAAELMNLAGNSTRLKLLYLLDNMKELCVCDLAEMLGGSVSAVSQHLSKLKAYGLVAPRRDAQTIYSRLTEHVFTTRCGSTSSRSFKTHRR
jgi:DNA-binding transcriptional ArsR family regulator